jgi:catecholate siderophore receptor
MGKAFSGIVSRAKARGPRLAHGLAVIAGATSLGGAAHAVEPNAFDAPTELSGVDVNPERRADGDTGLPTLLTTVQDTPQAITVIPAEQLRAQGVSTLEQALRNVPGITIAIGEGGQLNGDQFKIRGFDSKDDIYVDGLRDFGSYTRDSFNYQEVQVLKGPSGAMFGRGTTGGAINTVSKRPLLRDEVVLDGYVGSGEYYRALADINHKLSDTSAVRLNLMASSTGVVERDLIESKRWGVAASIGFGLGTDTSLTAAYLHQDDERRPDYGIVIVQRPGEILTMPATEYGVGVERSSFLGFANDRDDSTADILTVRITHKVSPWLTLTSDTRYGVYSRYFQYSTLDQCNAACTNALFDGNPATEAYGGIGGGSPYDMDSDGLQNITTARLDLDLGGMKSQTILGIDLSRQSNDKSFLAYTLPPGVATRPAMPHPIVNPDPRFPAGYTVFRPVPGANITCPTSGNCTTNVLGGTVFTNLAPTAALTNDAESTDLAIFVTERLWFTDTLSAIGSLRLDDYRAELDTVLITGAATPTVKAKSTLTSPRLSLVYEPTDAQTFYVSWGRSETPQGTSIVNTGTAITVTAKDLDPEVSTVWEVGAKAAVLDGRLTATASIFGIDKENSLQADPATGFLIAQSGEKQEVKGVELSVSGRVTDAWTVSGGYAYLDAKVKESFSNCAVPTSTTGTPTNIVCPVGVTAAMPVVNTVAVGRQVLFVPEHSASLFTTYDLGDWIEGLSIGGDVTYQSELNLVYAARSVSYADRGTLTPLRLGETPESLTFNAFASYDAGRYRVALNVYNLADRLNYTQVFGNRAIPSAGRTVVLSLGATF